MLFLVTVHLCSYSGWFKYQIPKYKHLSAVVSGWQGFFLSALTLFLIHPPVEYIIRIAALCSFKDTLHTCAHSGPNALKDVCQTTAVRLKHSNHFWPQTKNRLGLRGSGQSNLSLHSLQHFSIKVEDTKTLSLESHAPPLVQLYVMAVCPASSL